VGEDLGELREEAVYHPSQDRLLAGPIVHQATVEGESAPLPRGSCKEDQPKGRRSSE